MFTKPGAEIASPVDGGGNPRSVINAEMQVWMTEVEALYSVLSSASDFGKAVLGLTGANGSFIRGTGASTAVIQAIRGTVSQSGGVPTGALFSGWQSNSNGIWKRDADGSQVCIVPLAPLIFLSTSTVWTNTLSWPASFAAAPTPDATFRTDVTSPFGAGNPNRTNLGAPWFHTLTATTFQCRISHVTGTFNEGAETTENSGLLIKAVGRWF